MNRGQIAIEFMILISMGFFVALGIIISFSSLSADRLDQKAYLELQDLGRATQQEFLLAGELEDGYTRSFIIPNRINAVDYALDTGNATTYQSFFRFTFENQELYYSIPRVVGSLQKGANTIAKINGTLYVTNE